MPTDEVILFQRVSVSNWMQQRGRCGHHMIWLEVAGVGTWSSVVSWRAEPLSDNKPDGQRTGKGLTWQTTHDPDKDLCLFVLVCPVYSFRPSLLSDSCRSPSSPLSNLLLHVSLNLKDVSELTDALWFDPMIKTKFLLLVFLRQIIKN